VATPVATIAERSVRRSLFRRYSIRLRTHVFPSNRTPKSMIEATLCFPLRDRDAETDSEVLLIEKRRGLGEGWYNAPAEVRTRRNTARMRRPRNPRGSRPRGNGSRRRANSPFYSTVRATPSATSTARARSTGSRPRRGSPPGVGFRRERPIRPDVGGRPALAARRARGKTVDGKFRFEGGEPLDEAEFVGHDLEWDASF